MLCRLYRRLFRRYTSKRYPQLISSARFAALDLRDEAMERDFLAQLKAAGVPLADE